MESVKRRVISLDVFRGLTIAGMILVNLLAYYPETPALLKHAPWTGLTLADLVFPFLLFIVGVSMSYSFASRSKQSSGKLWGHFIFRVVVLYLIGIAVGFGFFLYGIPDFSSITIPGALQLIALSSLFAAPLARSKTRWVLVAASLLLVFQSAILLGVGAPGVPPGSLDVNNNIAGWVDSRVFGSSHLLYDNLGQDGLIAAINGTAMVMLGLACGRTLRLTKHDRDSVKYLIVGGTIALALGLIITPLLPLIKQLWTSSFILVNAGLGAIILAILYSYIDLLERGRILKLAVPLGLNALFIYIGSSVLGPILFISLMNRFNLHPTIVSILGLDMGVLAYGLISVAFWWVVAYLLHLRHIYIKL